MGEWFNILLGVPQGSILGPLIFNIFINDLFLFITNTGICNFADDNTLFKCSPNLSILFKALEKDTQIILNSFKNNYLKANPEKFQFMVLGDKHSKQYKLKISGSTIYSPKSVKLLGITIDKKLNFNCHIENICNAASYKLSALQRIRKYVTTEHAKRKSIYK